MTWDDFVSIKKIAFGALLAYVLWLVAGNVFGFAKMMQQQQHEQQRTLQQLRDGGADQAKLLRQNTEALARQNLERQEAARQNIERLQSGSPGTRLPRPVTQSVTPLTKQ